MRFVRQEPKDLALRQRGRAVTPLRSEARNVCLAGADRYSPAFAPLIPFDAVLPARLATVWDRRQTPCVAALPPRINDVVKTVLSQAQATMRP